MCTGSSVIEWLLTLGAISPDTQSIVQSEPESLSIYGSMYTTSVTSPSVLGPHNRIRSVYAPAN